MPCQRAPDGPPFFARALYAKSLVIRNLGVSAGHRPPQIHVHARFLYPRVTEFMAKSTDRFHTRCDRLRRLLKSRKLNSLLVTSFTNVSYLTGFTGDDSYLLLQGNSAVLISDFRYEEQLADECPGLDVLIRKTGESMVDAVAQVMGKRKSSSLGVEGENMTVSLHESLSSRLAMPLVPTAGLVEQLREIKDADEIEATCHAIWIAEKSLAVMKAGWHDNQTEQEFANSLEQEMQKHGGHGPAFPSIVAGGARSALPHARPTDQSLRGHEFVLIDFGAAYRQYRSDLTRIFVTGRISPKLERIYGVVLKAQQQAIAGIRPGVTGRQVDAIARETIAKAGFAKRFGHSLGHGIGLHIHEGPRLAAVNDRPLAPGMVVTVEPGIYLPGWGGIRIEDDVLVTKTGHEVLTSAPRGLEESVVC